MGNRERDADGRLVLGRDGVPKFDRFATAHKLKRYYKRIEPARLRSERLARKPPTAPLDVEQMIYRYLKQSPQPTKRQRRRMRKKARKLHSED